MATYNKFNSFVEAVAEKVHNFDSDTLKVALSNTAPSASDTVLADITQISSGNGYTAGGTQATTASSSQTGGTYKLVLNDVVYTATGGPIGPLRYAILYNDSAANDELIAWWDYGSSITLQPGETLTVDFNSSAGVLTIT